ncbi:hypothetical protein K1719_038263 [Acacia pycnantha]|nr:hypothetical protein K1719_038263 [Acacia pycnantha]
MGGGQETADEDPQASSKFAVSYVRGVQGDSFQGGKLTGHLQASACCKGVNRFVFGARVTLHDLADTYQPPFQNCIEQGRASGIT